MRRSVVDFAVDFAVAPAPRRDPTTVTFTPVAFAGAVGTFVLIGVTSSLFGPLLGTFAHHFAVSLATAGTALSLYYVGGVAGVGAGWLGVARLPGATVVSGALLTMSIGAIGVALARGWTVFAVALVVLGLGFGALATAINSLLARTMEDGRARRLSVVNAGFGVGAVAGPLLSIGVHVHHFATIFIGVAVLGAVLAASTRGLHAPAHHAEHSRHGERPAGRTRILVTFVVAYVLYEALESSASGWMATHLHRTGYSVTVSAVINAGFWAALAAARFAGGPAHRRWREGPLVLASLIGAAVCAAGALAHDLAPVAYPLLGVALASVFPMGVVWYARLSPRDSDGVSMVMLFAMLGGVIGPGGVDVAVAHLGVRVVPVALTVLAILDLAVFASLARVPRRRVARASSTATDAA